MRWRSIALIVLVIAAKASADGELCNLRIYRDGTAQNGTTHVLDGVKSVVPSSDGQHLYVTTIRERALSIYDVGESGALNNPRIYRNGITHILNEVWNIVFRPEPEDQDQDQDQYLYVPSFSSDSLSVYSVGDDGVLSNPRRYDHDGVIYYLYAPWDIVFSPNRKHLYLTSFYGNRLVAYCVNESGVPSNPRSYQHGEIQNGIIIPHELNGARNIALHSNGQHLYVTAFNGNALSVYDVDEDGALSNPRVYRHGEAQNDIIQELRGAESIALSSGDLHLYVTAFNGNALSVYDVDEDGALSNPRVYRHGETQNGTLIPHELNGARDIALSSGNQYLYVTAFNGNALSVYDVGEDGALSIVRVYRDGETQNGTSHELSGAQDIALSPNDLHLYVTAFEGNALSVYDVEVVTAPTISVVTTSAMQPTLSPTTSSVMNSGSNSIIHWPWWAKAIFGTGVSVTGFAALTAASCLIKKTWNVYKYPDGKPDFMQKVYQQLKRKNQRSTRRRSDHHPTALPMVAPRPRISLGLGSTINVEPTYVQPDSAEQNLPSYMEVMPLEAQTYEQPHIYETIDPITGAAQVNTAPTGQAQEYLESVASQVWVQTEIHQLHEQAPDELDGFELMAVSEEPWYANTNPDVTASAPVYTELNKPSARRALQCMEVQQSQQAGAGRTESGSLDCVGPGQSPTYFHAMVQLEGINPFSRLGKLKLNALAKGFDLVFKGMEAVDSYVYDFPHGHPKRTRVHTRHVAETLYGEHLITKELFNNRIGDMEDPIISFCNAMRNNVWHAFLVFRNSQTGEYNTLHIRQGSYYPEFMDKAATERYFHFEQKRIVGAISLTRLAELYGAKLDLNLLRDIFRQRLGSKEMRYRINNRNCMTFSMLAFWATNFDWAAFLQKVGLANLQSPYHILEALAGNPRNQPALHSQENNLLPDWLAELNQGDE